MDNAGRSSPDHSGSNASPQGHGSPPDPGNLPRARNIIGREIPDYIITPPLYLLGQPHTDAGNAERLIARHGGELLYVDAWNSWLVWDSERWRKDTTLHIEGLAVETARAYQSAALTINDPVARKTVAGAALALENRPKLKGMIQSARKLVALDQTAFDSDHWKLNLVNGTLNLKNGRLRGHSREDFITKICPYSYHPEAQCPMWEAFLCRIFNDNRRLIKFIQRALGYSLTGNTDEDALFVPYGTGANGKSTLLGVVKKVMGKDYTTEAAMDLLISVRKNGQTNDIADLRGKRLVTSVETGQRKWLNETLVKKITGGDEVTARRLFENNATFDPTFKVWLATNYKPRIGGTDRGIKRRVRLIPFDVEIPENEWVKDYDDQLIRKEARGILRWLVDGCKAWQADGLGFPPEVTEATERYFDEQDVLGTFLEEVCDRSDPDMETGSTHLLQAYKRFSNDNGMNAVLFSEQLQERGLKKKRTKSGIVWLGIRVSDESYW